MKGRRPSTSIFELPGGFYREQRVMARRDLYLEGCGNRCLAAIFGGDKIMAAFMDRVTGLLKSFQRVGEAIVLGPSRSSDPNRVCVQFEALSFLRLFAFGSRSVVTVAACGST